MTKKRELPKRKAMGLQEYDYSADGAYFVTVCSENKKCIFWGVVIYCDDDSVGAGFHARPRVRLSKIGEFTDQTINYIAKSYENVIIDKYVIMPNHVHLIIMLCGDETKSGGHGNPPLHAVVGQLKSYVVKLCGIEIWQRSFHEHIIRNEKDYQSVWQYIDES